MLNKFPLVVKLVQGYEATYFMPDFLTCCIQSPSPGNGNISLGDLWTSLHSLKVDEDSRGTVLASKRTEKKVHQKLDHFLCESRDERYTAVNEKNIHHIKAKGLSQTRQIYLPAIPSLNSADLES